jgi:hypothetical protein
MVAMKVSITSLVSNPIASIFSLSVILFGGLRRGGFEDDVDTLAGQYSLASLDKLHHHDPLSSCYFGVYLRHVDFVPQFRCVGKKGSTFLRILCFMQEIRFESHLLGNVVRSTGEAKSATSSDC